MRAQIFSHCVVRPIGSGVSVSITESPAKRLGRNTRTAGAWTKVGNPIFGRCRNCHGITLRGVCQHCGFTVVCMTCGKVRGPDKKWYNVPHEPVCDSHTYCDSCMRDVYDQISELRKAKRELEIKRTNLEAFASLSRGIKITEVFNAIKRAWTVSEAS